MVNGGSAVSRQMVVSVVMLLSAVTFPFPVLPAQDLFVPFYLYVCTHSRIVQAA